MSRPAGPPATWLSRLTIAQLRRIAFAIGAPSSGTKPVLTRQIQRELETVNTAKVGDRSQPSTPTSRAPFSVVSIDMGIRNLAYAHLVPAPVSEPSTDQRPALVAWRRLVISGTPKGNAAAPKREKELASTDGVVAVPLPAADGVSGRGSNPQPEKEAFDPSTLANYAYRFIKGILSRHQPTHVLIERQRFRSGGASAVQEWTIRVGVFEGMLHAVLKTLSEELGLQVTVQGVDPGRVTRYWLDGRADRRGRTVKESKKIKIDIVGESLKSSHKPLVDIGARSNQFDGQDVSQMAELFVARWKKKKDGSKRDHNAKEAFKLDDLSDCLLQGVAWLDWQKKRQHVLQGGLEAFADDPLFMAASLSPSRRILKKKTP